MSDEERRNIRLAVMVALAHGMMSNGSPWVVLSNFAEGGMLGTLRGAADAIIDEAMK